MANFATAYLAIVLVALAIAFLEQAFLQAFISRHTAWGLAPGWQREIAFWNVGLGVLIVGALRTRDPACVRVVVTAVVALTALLGTNHLLAARSNPRAWLHRVAATMNYLAVAAGLIVLWR